MDVFLKIFISGHSCGELSVGLEEVNSVSIDDDVLSEIGLTIESVLMWWGWLVDRPVVIWWVLNWVSELGE